MKSSETKRLEVDENLIDNRLVKHSIDKKKIE
jgi:hypothetical protein